MLLRTLMAIPGQQLVPVFYGAVERLGYRNLIKKLSYRRLRSDLSEAEVWEIFCRAFRQCIGRVDSYVHTAFPSEHVLWIHDKGKYDEDAKDSLRLSRTLSLFPHFPELSKVPEWRDKAPSHVVDTIYFGNSTESRAIQLADACCATITRFLQGNAVATPFYEILRSQVVNDGARPLLEHASADIERVHRKYWPE